MRAMRTNRGTGVGLDGLQMPAAKMTTGRLEKTVNYPPLNA